MINQGTLTSSVQRSAKLFVRGCEKFVIALAYLFCLALVGSCLARFAYFLADLCIFYQHELQNPPPIPAIALAFTLKIEFFCQTTTAWATARHHSPLPTTMQCICGGGWRGGMRTLRNGLALLCPWLPDGDSQILRSYVFGPSGFWTMAPLRYAAKFDPFLSLDCAPTPSTLAQSKERKGSNFAIWQHWLCPLCNFFRWNHMAWDDERLKRDSPRHILQLHRKGCKFHYEVVTRKKTGWWGRPQQTLSPCKSLC